MQVNYQNRLNIAHLPTPIEKLERLTRFLGGPEIWVKRDDQTGLAGGGNKTRKLEFLLADAQSIGCDHVVTMGAAQSNHCRQTAAACAKLGMGCSLILREGGSQPKNGNYLLNSILGAYVHWSEKETMTEVAEAVVSQLKSMGRKPYLIPYGGSNVRGASAYVLAMEELNKQLQAQDLFFDHIVLASSSGGTQAGLVLGQIVTKWRGKVYGICVDSSAETFRTQIAALTTATAAHLQIPLETSILDYIHLNDDYIGAGYGVVTETEREAIQLLGQLEGILLDPVYTGRAMGGLIDLIRWGAFTKRQRILFWHTGGMPALFAYADEIKPENC